MSGPRAVSMAVDREESSVKAAAEAGAPGLAGPAAGSSAANGGGAGADENGTSMDGPLHKVAL